jgi:molecular chaperone Hsp33
MPAQTPTATPFPEKIHKFYTEDLMIRASVARTTPIVRHMCEIQKLGPLARMGMGRALTGALLMASQLREGQQIGVHFRGDGPLGGLFAEASFESEARGYCHNGHADLPLKNGRLDLAGGVGRGLLSVARSQPFQKQPHIGLVPIVSGEIGDDLAHYLYQSHQIPSILALGVYLSKDGEVEAAGGVLIELMPGASESLIAELEARARGAGSLSQRILAGESERQILEAYAHGSPLVAVEHEYPITYKCRCSSERVDRTLLLLGRAALAEMILKGEPVAVQCQFCGRQYTVPVSELQALIKTLA